MTTLWRALNIFINQAFQLHRQWSYKINKINPRQSSPTHPGKPSLSHTHSVADIRGGRDKDDNSSVRFYHLLTQRHTPHPHCSPSVGGNIFPQSMHLSHISYCTFTYIYIQTVNSMFINIAGLRTPTSDSGSGRRVWSISLDFT